MPGNCHRIVTQYAVAIVIVAVSATNASAAEYLATLTFPSIARDSAGLMVDVPGSPQPTLSHCMIEAERMERVLRPHGIVVRTQVCEMVIGGDS